MNKEIPFEKLLVSSSYNKNNIIINNNTNNTNINTIYNSINSRDQTNSSNNIVHIPENEFVSNKKIKNIFYSISNEDNFKMKEYNKNLYNTKLKLLDDEKNNNSFKENNIYNLDDKINSNIQSDNNSINNEDNDSYRNVFPVEITRKFKKMNTLGKSLFLSEPIKKNYWFRGRIRLFQTNKQIIYKFFADNINIFMMSAYKINNKEYKIFLNEKFNHKIGKITSNLIGNYFNIIMYDNEKYTCNIKYVRILFNIFIYRILIYLV